MEYRDFVEQVSKDLRLVLPSDLKNAEISTQEVEKLQGASYYGLGIMQEGSRIGITMDLMPGYDRMNRGIEYDTVLREIGQRVVAAIQEQPEINPTEFLDYDAMKERLKVELVPTELNKDLLTTIPHQEIEDMSLIYRFVLDQREDRVATATVTNNILQRYGIDQPQLHEDAMKNSPELFPPQIRSMKEILAEMMAMDPELIPGDDSMFVATCNDGINGAGCIFYPNFMEQAADQLGGNFYVIPSSVHEVILLPDNGTLSAQELNAMVQEVNASEVPPEDRLSDQAFHYDAKEKLFEKASGYEERQQASREPKKQSIHEKLKEAQAKVEEPSRSSKEKSKEMSL